MPCAIRFHRKTGKPWKEWGRSVETYSCEECQKEFEGYRRGDRKVKYCSQECRTVGMANKAYERWENERRTQ